MEFDLYVSTKVIEDQGPVSRVPRRHSPTPVIKGNEG